MTQWRIVSVVVALLLFAVVDVSAVGVTLKGSPASIERQHLVAREQGFTFVETPEQVPELVAAEQLIPVTGNADYEVLPTVSHKVARPELRLFIERLAAQYHESTGERLVVTSLTRAASSQPQNSHPLSVHPTGMAVDLRISQNATSRAWLEGVLLKLERQGVLDVTRERFPPHYHVALFPTAYTDYVEAQIGSDALAEALKFEQPGVALASEPVAQAEAGEGRIVKVVAAATAPESTGFGRAIALVFLGSLVLGGMAVELLSIRPREKSLVDRDL